MRSLTESITYGLSAEDQTVQSMPDVSPTKWHRAHTNWFFESFLLVPHLPGYKVFHPDYAYLFNSYYEGVGARYPRADRGFISRPGVEEVADYRRHVDEAMAALFDSGPRALLLRAERACNATRATTPRTPDRCWTLEHVLSRNPMQPAFDAIRASCPRRHSGAAHGPNYRGGNYDISHAEDTFASTTSFPVTACTCRPSLWRTSW